MWKKRIEIAFFIIVIPAILIINKNDAVKIERHGKYELTKHTNKRKRLSLLDVNATSNEQPKQQLDVSGRKEQAR